MLVLKTVAAALGLAVTACRGSSAGPFSGWVFGEEEGDWLARRSLPGDFFEGTSRRQLVGRLNCPASSFATVPAPPDSNTYTMFGAFRFTNPLSGGLLWYVPNSPALLVPANLRTRKIPWRLSKFQKYRQRKRLRAVDSVVATVDAALAKTGETLKQLERWKAEMPTEAEMLPKDKYTMFDRKAKRYRKGIHSEFLLLGSLLSGWVLTAV